LMIIVFGLEPRSVIMAYMLSRVNGAKAVLFNKTKQYYFDDVTDARFADYDNIYSEYRESHGRIDFVEDQKLYDVISADIFWALRFRALDSGALVLQVLEQIEEKGSKYYLSETTPESKEMRLRVKRVLSEFNRALRFVRFERHEEVNLSMGKASFDNDIADMVLRAESIRTPENYTIALLDDRMATVLFNGEIFTSRKQKIPLVQNRKDFKNFWTGLPESARSILIKDEMRSIKEIPPIIFPKTDESEELDKQKSTVSLDDFS